MSLLYYPFEGEENINYEQYKSLGEKLQQDNLELRSIAGLVELDEDRIRYLSEK